MRAIVLAFLVLFSAVATLCGAVIMVYDLYSGGSNFMQGFTIFCLSSILLLVSIISYIVTKTLSNTEVLSEVLATFVANELKKESSANPLQGIFGNMFGGPGMPPNITTIKMGKMNEDGSITPLGESSTEDFIKNRDSILAKAFGFKGPEAQKKFEDMNLDELKVEEKKAVDSQQFELAAALRDLISEKEGNKE